MRAPGVPWTTRWWGGPLADGTTVVTNPMVPPNGIIDLTIGNDGAHPQTDTPAPAAPAPQQTAREWLLERTRGRLDLGPADEDPGADHLVVTPTRLSRIALWSSWVIAAVAVVCLFAYEHHILGLLLCVVALVGGQVTARAVEWHLIGSTGEPTLVGDEDGGPLAPIRYVDAVTAATAAWARLEAAAERVHEDRGPGSRVHWALWGAAGVFPDAVTGDLDEASLRALDEFAEQAEAAVPAM